MTETAAGMLPHDSDPAFVPDASVEVSNLNVWFGQKVALSELSCSFGPGVTGLLGPNGAGKSTLMRAMCGLLDANGGSVRVLGKDPRKDREVHRTISLVPEDEAVPGRLTARQLVQYVADLHGVSAPGIVEQALNEVDMMPAADRKLSGFSKGMRQRAKVAAALVTNPTVLVVDEPLNGADPVQRANLIALFKRIGAGGRTVIVSSHVLHEVERMADRIVVVINGRLAAAGNHRAIRDAMDGSPRHVLIRSDASRSFAAALLELDSVVGISVTDNGLVVTTTRAGELALAVAPLAKRLKVRLREVRPLDDSLDSLFKELVR